MTIFRCDYVYFIGFVAVFAAAWNAALLWFLKKGFIAIGNKQGLSGGTWITYRAETPFRFWVLWVAMLGAGNFVTIKALIIVTALCNTASVVSS